MSIYKYCIYQVCENMYVRIKKIIVNITTYLWILKKNFEHQIYKYTNKIITVCENIYDYNLEL